MSSEDFNYLPKKLSSAYRAVCGVVGLGLMLSGCHRGESTLTTEKEDSGSHLVTVGNSPGIVLDDAGRKLAGVTTETAGISAMAAGVQPTGEIAATDSGTVQVTARLPGRIAETRVMVGSRVAKGQVLATVDSIDLTAAEATYRTAQEHAKLAYNQLIQQRKLAGFGTISEQPIEDTRKALAAAEAAVSGDEAQIQLDKLTLENTKQLVDLGEITRKPMEDAQNAYAQAQSALAQANINVHSTKSNLDRTAILFNGGVFSKQQLEDADTANNNAIAAVDQAVTQEKLAAEELKRQQAIFATRI